MLASPLFPSGKQISGKRVAQAGKKSPARYPQKVMEVTT
jgi:hypothetical protein